MRNKRTKLKWILQSRARKSRPLCLTFGFLATIGVQLEVAVYKLFSIDIRLRRALNFVIGLLSVLVV